MRVFISLATIIDAVVLGLLALSTYIPGLWA